MSEIRIERMWQGGPLRQRADTRPWPGWGLVYDKGGFAGQYVCDECQQPGVGLYRQNSDAASAKWLCGVCSDSAKVKQEQPEHLRKYRRAKE